MRSTYILRTFAAMVLAAVVFASAPVAANIVLSKVILDFAGGAVGRDDIEVLNTGDETAFVVIEPKRIDAPGLPEEQRVEARDPAELGLLVTPNRMVLQPGERRIVRFAVIEPARDQDRIFRVTIKPVVGEIISEQTALKLLVGYEVLVIVRPSGAEPFLRARRDGHSLVITNDGNTNALLTNGRQCDPSGENCVELPSKRLYAGASWQVELEQDTPVEYRVRIGRRSTVEQY